MEKSHFSIQLGPDNGLPNLKRSFQIGPIISAEMGPLKLIEQKAEIKVGGTNKSGFSCSENSVHSGTFVTKLDIAVEGVKESPNLHEYVKTLSVPLTHINKHFACGEPHEWSSLDTDQETLFENVSGIKDLNSSTCSCCSEELYIGCDKGSNVENTNESDVENVNNHQTSSFYYLEEKVLSGNKHLFSFVNGGLWDKGSDSRQISIEDKNDSIEAFAESHLDSDKKCSALSCERSEFSIGFPHRNECNNNKDLLKINSLDQSAKNQRSDNSDTFINNHPNVGINECNSLVGYNKDMLSNYQTSLSLTKDGCHNVLKPLESSKSFSQGNVTFHLNEDIAAKEMETSGRLDNNMKHRSVPEIVVSNPSLSTFSTKSELEVNGNIVPHYHSNLNMNVRDLNMDENWNITKQRKANKRLKLPKTHSETQIYNNEERVVQNGLLHVPLSHNDSAPVLVNYSSPPRCRRKMSLVPSKNSASDLEELKIMAEKMNLCTRRPSYMLWKERLNTNSFSFSNTQEVTSTTESDDVTGNSVKKDERPYSARVDAVNQALSWLKRELNEMRSQDQVLARTLIQVREDIRELKLQRSCAEHQEILEDARDLEEEKDILGELSCEYIQETFSPTLKQVGLTRMNIGSRRFSVF